MTNVKINRDSPLLPWEQWEQQWQAKQERALRLRERLAASSPAANGWSPPNSGRYTPREPAQYAMSSGEDWTLEEILQREG